MGRTHDFIDAGLKHFLESQPVFFVATAPLAADGLVNLSPKGLDSFRVLDLHTVAYLDLTGSGVETIAHLRENGRIVLCFCAFDGPPKIVRLHGRGEAIEPGDPRFGDLAQRFPDYPAARSVIRVEVHRIAASCGYGVPRLRCEGQRSQLAEWAERKGPEGIRAYKDENNRRSVEGLPGLRR